VGTEPEAGRHKLRRKAVVSENLLRGAGLLGYLSGAERIEIGHGIVIVKLQSVESQLIGDLHLLQEGEGFPHWRTEGISPFAEIPWPE
jgi:hypothetical protein